jgi:hypothetical protein
MPFALLLIGAVLIVVALNNTHAQLATQLESDVPGYFRWGAAIVALLALGYIPGLRSPSRWLLALVVVAIVVKTSVGTQLFAAIANFARSGGAVTPAAPASGSPGAPAAAASPFGGQTGSISDILGAVGGSGNVSDAVAAFSGG